MTTPLKGLFGVMLKFPSLPAVRRQTSWDSDCPWDHRGQIHSVVRVGDLNPGLRTAFKSTTLTTEPCCLTIYHKSITLSRLDCFLRRMGWHKPFKQC